MPPSQCQKCGATNYASTLFCQSCGNPLSTTAPLPPINTQPSPTDWYGARPNQPPPGYYQPPMPAPPPIVYVPVQAYRCRWCGSPYPPQIIRKMTTGGYVALIIGLFFCLAGALICLAFIENQHICPSCGHRVF
jgi:LITAF-like zinc ribbon domain